LIRENYNTIRIIDFFLLANFFIITSIGSLYLYNVDYISKIIHLTWPVLMVLLALVSLYIIALITGERDIFKDNYFHFFLLPQFFGIILTPLLIVGFFHPEYINLIR